MGRGGLEQDPDYVLAMPSDRRLLLGKEVVEQRGGEEGAALRWIPIEPDHQPRVGLGMSSPQVIDEEVKTKGKRVYTFRKG